MQANGNGCNDRSDSGSVLIAGAGFAGLASAWCFHKLGYAVTVVEVAPGVRRGGTPVDIREGVVAVVRRMGLLEAIQAASLPPRPTQFLRPDGSAMVQNMPPEPSAGEEEGRHEGETADAEYEIERDTLLDLLYERVRGAVSFRFGDSIDRIEPLPEGVAITFASGERRSFSLLLGCDGTHSAVRRMCFGEESLYLYFLQHYFSLSILPKLLIPENTSQILSVPGRTVMLNAYHGKTDVAFSFFLSRPIEYDRHNRVEQRQRIRGCFDGMDWRIGELLHEMDTCEDFYFDQLCQIRMSAWTVGRVALVGDAGYCPSPAAGMGGSMALLGAAALADAFAAHPGDVAQAFAAYERELRPVVQDIQEKAVDFGMKMFLPSSDDEIEQRNTQLHLR